MKKTTQPLLLVFSTLLLLVSVTVNAQGQPAPGQPSNPANFTGVWNTITDKGEKLVITLRHERSDSNLVIGSYHLLGDVTDKPLDGALKGTVKDNVLRFTWSSDEGRRAGRFTLSSDGESFEGTYSATRNPDDTSGGTWKGTRVHSFAGASRGKFGDGGVELVLQQSGRDVAGQLNINSVIYVIREGRVDANNTLRFLSASQDSVWGNCIRSRPRHWGIGDGCRRDIVQRHDSWRGRERHPRWTLNSMR